MKADSLRIAKVFSSGGDVHYFLPHFQREYAWEKENWQTLLNDVLGLYEVYNPEKEPEHFMGSLVVINDGTRNGTVPVFKLVDGQQRLITISLLLCALGRFAKDSHPALYKKIRRMVTNPEEEELLHYKLLPTTKYGDREIYLAILKDDSPLPKTDSKIPQAFEFLSRELGSRIKAGKIDPEKLFIVLANCLQVVFIDLNQEERPYEIFESLNAKGMPLSQADLVRNYIAMKLPETRQEEIFNKYWSKIENLLQEKRTVGRSNLGELTAFLRHYLAYRSGILCNEKHVYARFRDRIEAEFKTPAAFEQEVATLRRFAEYYNRLLRPDQEPDPGISSALKRLNTLEISTAYPFLLAVYEAVNQNRVAQTDFFAGLKVLENYMVRRYLVGEPTNYLNKVFPALWKDIDPNDLVHSMSEALVSRKYPADHKVRQATLTEQLYDNRSQTREKICLILESINRHLSDLAQSGGYTILSSEPTIEHIMPQTISQTWKDDLGQNWEQTFEDYLDTLGNLTLVTQSWNSALSNSAFVVKKQKLATHELRLNKDYFSNHPAEWNEQRIRNRADWLANQILEVWPAIGDPPAIHGGPSTKPKALILLGETHTVSTWRDVANLTSECIVQLCDDFDKIAQELPAYFSKEKFLGACRQLTNGWWLYVNLSRAATINFCRNLFNIAGLSEEDWQVEEE
jgi:uncharacterized protein with ParB-like and HNH nuclease domain